MDRPHRDKSIHAYIGFTYETVIRSRIAPNRACIEFESREDAHRKRTLFNEFRTEMIDESDLFANAFKRFQEILLQMPSTADPEIYLSEIIEEKIATQQKRIDFVRQATIHPLWSIPIVGDEKAKAQPSRQQQLEDLQSELKAIQQWEMVRRIFEQVECKDLLKEISSGEQSSWKSASQTLFDELPTLDRPLRRAKLAATSTSTLQAEVKQGMAVFLNRLDKEALSYKKYAPPPPIDNPSPVKMEGARPSESFI